nr:MAG TPA: hypothetical protein [Caudoviricetes sp.]
MSWGRKILTRYFTAPGQYHYLNQLCITQRQE